MMHGAVQCSSDPWCVEVFFPWTRHSESMRAVDWGPPLAR
jgi:hypothetical protein